MPPDSIRLFVIDSQRLMRTLLEHALAAEPDFAVIATASDAREAQAVLMQLAERVDIAILHLGLPGDTAIHFLPEIHVRFPECRVVALDSAPSDDRRRALAISSGAIVVLSIDASFADLVGLVRRAHRGDSMMAANDLHVVLRDATRWRTAEERARVRFERLTPREAEILQALVRGCSDKEIAHDLGVKGKTVATHVANVLDKLDVASRLQAALLAIRYGFVDITRD
jgi:two-component system nitrate/nitrite response regulator NarL